MRDWIVIGLLAAALFAAALWASDVGADRMQAHLDGIAIERATE